MNTSYADLRAKLNRPLFIPFAVVGDPDIQQSVRIIETLIENGADALELGFPFSDPTADGPVIQAADVRALKSGITIDDCFAILRDIRKKSSLPIGLLVYFNIVMKRGIGKFYADCKAAGVNSVLIADLPPEHADEVHTIAIKNDVAEVFIVSELTTPERLKRILGFASGYLYLVSYLGITGALDGVLKSKITDLTGLIRPHTTLPLFVGFGIQTVDHVRNVIDAGADGAIVGSRIVAAVPDLKKIATICAELRTAFLPL